jgi:putative nucleotidyltransferase with HDIG domain
LHTSETSTSSLMNLDLEKIAAQTGDLPALPTVGMSALEMANDPNVSSRDLQFIISKDQALTARILKIVNSAMYCFQREVSILSHAISILGLDTVRSVIVAASVQSAFQIGGPAGKDLTTQLFWQHSWGAAIAAKALALSTGYANKEEAFTCGLIHDLGKLVMLRNRAELYREILNGVYQGRTTFCEAELQTFGFTHAQLGAVLAGKWSFPSQLAEAIACHHDFASASGHRQLAAIVCLANRMMALLEVGFQKDASLKLEEEEAARFLKLSAATLQKMVPEVKTVILTSPGNLQS